MLRKEVDSSSPTSPSKQEPLMERLIRSFGNENWKEDPSWANNKKEFVMYMESPFGGKIQYFDSGGDPKCRFVEISFYSQKELTFVFRQLVGKDGIKNHVIMPLTDNNPGGHERVHYGPDGWMDPVRNIEGVPKKIDMDATVETLIEQIIAAKFWKPRLILPGKK